MTQDSKPTILVINPNSNLTVTQAIEQAVEPLRFANGPAIKCIGMSNGPLGIETQSDADCVVMPLIKLVRDDTTSAAFVIACYSEPGVIGCREATRRPIFGIGECGMLTAMAQGERVGIITTKQAAIRRHMRNLRRYGFEARFAGERAIDQSVEETAAGGHTLDRMIEVGQALIRDDGADVIVMGCGGMTAYLKDLEQALSVPVVDPVQAATIAALGVVAIKQGLTQH